MGRGGLPEELLGLAIYLVVKAGTFSFGAQIPQDVLLEDVDRHMRTLIDLRALGVPDQDVPADLTVAVGRYRSELAGKRMLIVLDNAASEAQVRPLLPGTAGCAAIVFLAFTAMAFITTGQQDLALLSACLVGACVGFLWFNSFPASVFMGDTGSLGLGGAIAALAVMTKTEVLLIVIGGIFVIEALSVAIQVFAFQRFRKRVFLMAPIHHHFELQAWSETKIILRFWIVASVCAAIGFTLYQQSITP